MIVRKIKLGGVKHTGYVAYVDADLYDEINQFNWSPRVHNHTVYAARRIRVNGKRTTAQYLHRFVMELRGVACPEHVDHRDGSGLNNCSFNLRPVSNGENKVGSRRAGSSKFTGVSRHARDRNWQAHIKPLGRAQSCLGCFDKEVDAARAYDRAARDFYGEDAKVNFPNYTMGFVDIDDTHARATCQPTLDWRNEHRESVLSEHCADIAKLMLGCIDDYAAEGAKLLEAEAC